MSKNGFRYVERMKTRHGQTLTYYRPTREHRYRMRSTPGTPEFETEYYDLVKHHLETVSVETKNANPRFTRTVDVLSRKLIKCRARDKARGMESTIDINWVVLELKRNNYCCSLTGIPFQVGARETKVNPYSPSIDRIDNSKGYTPENSRLVLYAVNTMMLDWGDDVFRHVVTGYVLRNLSGTPNLPPTSYSTSIKSKA